MRTVKVRDFQPADRLPLVRMWRESFEYGVGIVSPHPLDDQIQYFEQEVRAKSQVRVALDDDLIVGFLACTTELVAQLYVRVGHHRQGVGSHLLSLAKAGAGGSLWLFTFARNKNACAFYESQGFTVVQRGFEPMWQLEDVKYSWSSAASAA